jgi:vacuolar-type H+-ATPase subunit D/Vma8
MSKLAIVEKRAMDLAEEVDRLRKEIERLRKGAAMAFEKLEEAEIPLTVEEWALLKTRRTL